MRPSGSAPILPLTSVRFFAALYVVLLHSAMLTHHLDTTTWSGRFIRSGYTAVGFFFVLSGYILAYVYLDGRRPFSRQAFWISRLARAYPLLLTSLLLDAPHDYATRIALHGFGSGIVRSTAALLSECALLQSWDVRFRNLNAPSWSLSAEAFFYLVFPYVCFRIFNCKGLKALGLIVLFWVCALLTPFIVILRHPELFAQVDTSKLEVSVELMPVFRMFEFCAGIALCSLQKSLAEKFTTGQRSRLSYLFLGAAFSLFIVIINFANYIPPLVMSNGLLLPASALMILGFTNIGGWVASLLSMRPFVILGEASYAVYLLHMPLWFYFVKVWPINTLSAWACYLAVVLTASVASFFFLERPARAKILKLAAIRPPVTSEHEVVAKS